MIIYSIVMSLGGQSEISVIASYESKEEAELECEIIASHCESYRYEVIENDLYLRED